MLGYIIIAVVCAAIVGADIGLGYRVSREANMQPTDDDEQEATQP